LEGSDFSEKVPDIIFEVLVILLMVQKSQTTTWDVKIPVGFTGIN